MSKIFRRAIAAGMAISLLLAGSATIAAAAPRGFVEVDHPAGRFYGGFGSGVLLFTGEGGAEDICNQVPEPTVTARVFERNDGSVDLKVNAQEVPFVLYDTELDAISFIEQTCELLFDGDDETMPVQPFASGTAKFKERISSSPDGVDEIFNGVNGFASSPDGTTWKVRTWADFVVDNDMLIGDPAEFQGISIRQLGR
jgi:hypothetical protein